METKRWIKNLGLIAGIIGIVQGLAWVILALLVVLIYSEAWTPNIDVTSPSHDNLLKYVFLLLLTDNTSTDLLMGPQEFLVCSIIYLIISIIWIGVSSHLIWSLNRQTYKLVKTSFMGWGLWTIFMCIYDGTLIGLFSFDYNYLSNLSGSMPMLTALPYYMLAFGILISLAARGYILWINNIIMALFMIKISINDFKTIPEQKFVSDPIDGFRKSKKPDLGNLNHGYYWEDDKPHFAEDVSFVSPSPQSNNQFQQNYPKVYPKPYKNDRLAKIGKQGRRSPPLNINPPKLPQTYIYPTQPRVPSPDYSPPNSPPRTPLKSVLKNRPAQNPFVFQNRY